MRKFNPCIDYCFLHLNKKYKKERCVDKCEFAQVCDERDKLKKFKQYFDSLYGQGLQVANWHLNGNLESFDMFYESALEEMENE